MAVSPELENHLSGQNGSLFSRSQQAAENAP